MALVQVRSAEAAETPSTVTAAAAETTGTTPRWQVVVGSIFFIILFWAVSIAINYVSKPSALVIPAGISLFAMLYAVTQGVERLLEPVSSFFFSTKQHVENRNKTMAAAVNLHTAPDSELPTKLAELTKAAQAVEELQKPPGVESSPPAQATGAARPGRFGRGWHQVRRNVANEGVTEARTRVQQRILPALKGDDLDPARVTEKLADLLNVQGAEAPAVARKAVVDLAAAAQAELDQRRADKSVAYWAVASVVGLLFSGTLGLYLLHTVGLHGDGVVADDNWRFGLMSWPGLRHMLDILVTGLAIGGGTKPLHDLISNLQSAKDAKKDPGETSAK